MFVRYNVDGSIDPSFGEKGLSYLVAGGEPFAALQLSDGSFVVPGAQILGSVLGSTLDRLLPDGLPDATWGSAGVLRPATGLPVSGLTSGLLTSDGKLIVTGIAGPQPSLVGPVGFYLARFWL